MVNEDILKRLRIAVLMGGNSSEREISLKSGKAVYQSLKDAGFNVVPIDVREEDAEKIISAIKQENVDVVFIAMHGRFGEDGTLQEILENASIPYTGSGPKASRLAMDKVAARIVFEQFNIPVPRYRVFENSLLCKINLDDLDALGFPLVIKPASSGSSIGVSIVTTKEDLMSAIELAFNHDERIIIEEYLQGRELTVGILEDEPLAPVEIIPRVKFFDYQAKYTPGLTDYRVPAQLPTDIYEKVQDVALHAHRSLGCRAFSRVDMILKDNSIPCVLEINTIPGLTQTSLLPKAANAKNISFLELCIRVISLASHPALNNSENEKEKINL